MKILRPPILQPGDVIAVVSPGRWLAPDKIESGCEILAGHSLQTRVSKQNFLRDHQFAGTDEERLRALNEAIRDPAVKAIICARGGYGCGRIADGIDCDALSANPKIVIGYSDVTALLCHIHKHTGLVTFHGPMLYTFSRQPTHLSISSFIRSVTAREPLSYHFSAGEIRVLRPGIGEGRLIGGNLSLISSSIGTSSAIDTRGAVLFIEDVDERLYRIDRMMLHLKRSGLLENLAGLIVGEPVNFTDDDIPFGRQLDEIVLDYCRENTFPIASNFPCGHGKSIITLPIGIDVRLETSPDRGVTIQALTSAVC
ncbi:MAG: LD-carboxypeptidase [Chthoniobacteraceae bacterium]